MKSSKFLTGLGMLLLATFLAAPLAAQNRGIETVDRIVAVVDDDIIVRSELDTEIRKVLIQLRKRGSNLPSREVLERQVLERLILLKLQLAAAARAGISVSEDILAQAISNIARNNNVTLSQFRQTLEAEGISFDSFREDIRAQIIMQRLRDTQILNRIRVTQPEIDAWLSRQAGKVGERSAYHLLHILIATPEGASPEELQAAREKAERLVKQLRAGADFRDLALTESDGRQALEGGDLGWRAADQLPTLFVDKVIDMQRGEISDPIRSSGGYHIIKLEDFRGGERRIVNQNHVRLIRVDTNEVTSDATARTRLEQLRQRIQNGDDFAALARAHSDDKASAIKGGDLGWVSPGALLPDIEKKLEEMSPGDLSEPFRTDIGWYLVQLVDRRQYDSTDEARKAEAREAIRKRKLAEETELYLRRLRDEAYIDIRLDDDF